MKPRKLKKRRPDTPINFPVDPASYANQQFTENDIGKVCTACRDNCPHKQSLYDAQNSKPSMYQLELQLDITKTLAQRYNCLCYKSPSNREASTKCDDHFKYLYYHAHKTGYICACSLYQQLTDFIHVDSRGVWGIDMDATDDLMNPIIYEFSIGIPTNNGACKILKVYYLHLHSTVAPNLGCKMTLTTQWDLINLVKQLNCFPIGQSIIINVKAKTMNKWGSKLPLINPTVKDGRECGKSDVILQCLTTIRVRSIIHSTFCSYCHT
jgi:hypothetical protein